MSADEAEVRHVDTCEHPDGPCLCPREHLLGEAARIRDMCLFAEAEFARENRRAVDLSIECGHLREMISATTDPLLEQYQNMEGDFQDLEGQYFELAAERDRLRATLSVERRVNAESGCPDCGVHAGCHDAVAERDRLWTVVAKMRQWIAVTEADLIGMLDGEEGTT